jgi:hypothetical protein
MYEILLPITYELCTRLLIPPPSFIHLHLHNLLI